MRIPDDKTRLFLFWSLFAVGCTPASLYRTADPVPNGKWRATAAGGIGTLRDTEQKTRLPIFPVEVGVRRGVGKNLDLGMRLYSFGSELNATWRIHEGTWSIALAPAFGGIRVRTERLLPESLHLHAALAVVATRHFTPRWSLSLAPVAGWGLYLPVTGGNAQGTSAGLISNIDLRVGEHWHFLPELSVQQTVTGSVPVHGHALVLGAGFARDWW